MYFILSSNCAGSWRRVDTQESQFSLKKETLLEKTPTNEASGCRDFRRHPEHTSTSQDHNHKQQQRKTMDFGVQFQTPGHLPRFSGTALSVHRSAGSFRQQASPVTRHTPCRLLQGHNAAAIVSSDPRVPGISAAASFDGPLPSDPTAIKRPCKLLLFENFLS